MDQRDTIEALRKEGKERAAKALEAIARQTGSDAIDMDVWVARDRTVRRYEMSAPFALPGIEGGNMRLTMELFDFGIEPDIAVPDPGSVYDATDVARQGLEQLGR